MQLLWKGLAAVALAAKDSLHTLKMHALEQQATIPVADDQRVMVVLFLATN